MQAPSTTLVLRASSSSSVHAESRDGSLSPSPPVTGVVLPLVLAELGHDGPHPLEVVVVGEVGPEGAAPVVGAVGVDATAARAEDARPARRQPGEVDAEALPGVRRVGELGPRAGDVERRLGHAHHPRGGTPGQPLRWAHAPRGHRRRIEHGPPARRRRAPRRPAAARLQAQDRAAPLRARHRRRPHRRRGPRPARRFVQECLDVAEDQGVEDLSGFVTSAIREAPNGDDVLRAGRGAHRCRARPCSAARRRRG